MAGYVEGGALDGREEVDVDGGTTAQDQVGYVGLVQEDGHVQDTQLFKVVGGIKVVVLVDGLGKNVGVQFQVQEHVGKDLVTVILHCQVQEVFAVAWD